jgi:hypothetical protein
MKIISIITNNSIFVELQYKSLKKHVHEPYEYIVFNDGKSWPDFTNHNNPLLGKISIENKCKEFDVKCINLENSNHKNIRQPSGRHSTSLKFLVNYMKENPDEYLILDGDMFLIDTLDISKYRKFNCACVFQKGNAHLNFYYIWGNLFYMNFNTLKFKDDLDFNIFPGEDTGSCTNKWLSKFNYSYPIDSENVNNKDFYTIRHLSSCTWDINNIPDNLKSNENLKNVLTLDPRNVNNMFFAEIYDKCFFHYRAGTWCHLDKGAYIQSLLSLI